MRRIGPSFKPRATVPWRTLSAAPHGWDRWKRHRQAPWCSRKARSRSGGWESRLWPPPCSCPT